MRSLNFPLVLSFGLVCQQSASAHAKETHVNISKQAIAYLQSVSPNRPGYPVMLSQLPYGASHEDDFFFQAFPEGRFFFHFLPNLTSLLFNSSCTSLDWGFGDNGSGTGVPCTGSVEPSSIEVNTHRWQDAVKGVDSNDSPTDQGWLDLGYVVHLLEDLTSPAHTRNDPHPCIAGLGPACDKFESQNRGNTPQRPVAVSLIGAPDPSSLSDPKSFFLQLQPFVAANFFSSGSVFSPMLPQPPPPPPPLGAEDSQYFYGACLGPNDPACDSGRRRIARKGLRFKLTGNKTNAYIDNTIASEQFEELGPLTVLYVASFLKLYAPALTVQVQGSGTVTSSPSTGINCGATCSALFVQGMSITLTANPPSGSTVTWGGDCAFGGTSTTVSLTLTADTSCNITFSTPPGRGDCSYITTLTFENPSDPKFSLGPQLVFVHQSEPSDPAAATFSELEVFNNFGPLYGRDVHFAPAGEVPDPNLGRPCVMTTGTPPIKLCPISGYWPNEIWSSVTISSSGISGEASLATAPSCFQH